MFLQERDVVQEHYLAQIAAEIRRTNVATPNKVKVKDFLIELRAGDSPNPVPPCDKVIKSKNAWLTATGAEPKKKKGKK